MLRLNPNFGTTDQVLDSVIVGVVSAFRWISEIRSSVPPCNHAHRTVDLCKIQVTSHTVTSIVRLLT
jgi:hypothetical protein